MSGRGAVVPIRRAYGELDRDRVVSSLLNLARRVGVRHVTMRELASELGAAVPSVYYHVPGKPRGCTRAVTTGSTRRG